MRRFALITSAAALLAVLGGRSGCRTANGCDSHHH
jgi:hypothetical protein